MTHLGVLCNLEAHRDPLEQPSPSVINRAYLIDELLAPEGHSCLSLLAEGRRPLPATRSGTLQKGTPVAVRQPVPRVNANWSYATRRLLRHGMGYQPLKRWLRERGSRSTSRTSSPRSCPTSSRPTSACEPGTSRSIPTRRTSMAPRLRSSRSSRARGPSSRSRGRVTRAIASSSSGAPAAATRSSTTTAGKGGRSRVFRSTGPGARRCRGRP